MRRHPARPSHTQPHTAAPTQNQAHKPPKQRVKLKATKNLQYLYIDPVQSMRYNAPSNRSTQRATEPCKPPNARGIKPAPTALNRTNAANTPTEDASTDLTGS